MSSDGHKPEDLDAELKEAWENAPIFSDKLRKGRRKKVCASAPKIRKKVLLHLINLVSRGDATAGCGQLRVIKLDRSVKCRRKGKKKKIKYLQVISWNRPNAIGQAQERVFRCLTSSDGVVAKALRPAANTGRLILS